MRIRCIKPEFWQSESLSRVSREARLLFIGLFSACDDSGRTRAASRFLASLLFPYDEDAPKRIEGWMVELERENCVRRYVVHGNTYLEIPKWLDHQKIDKPSPSRIPPFAEGSRGVAEDSRTLVVGSGIRDQGSGKGIRDPQSPEEGVVAIYEAYPRRVGRTDALKAIRAASKAKPADHLLERTRAYAAAVARWPEADRRFVPHPATWFNRGSYDDDPATWVRIPPPDAVIVGTYDPGPDGY